MTSYSVGHLRTFCRSTVEQLLYCVTVSVFHANTREFAGSREARQYCRVSAIRHFESPEVRLFFFVHWTISLLCILGIVMVVISAVSRGNAPGNQFDLSN